MNIQRYDIENEDGATEYYVLHTDHIAAMREEYERGVRDALKALPGVLLGAAPVGPLYGAGWNGYDSFAETAIRALLGGEGE